MIFAVVCNSYKNGKLLKKYFEILLRNLKFNFFETLILEKYNCLISPINFTSHILYERLNWCKKFRLYLNFKWFLNQLILKCKLIKLN